MTQLNAATITVINEAVNSAGTGGGSALKYAVKLPNLLTVRFAPGSSVSIRSATNANEIRRYQAET